MTRASGGYRHSFLQRIVHSDFESDRLEAIEAVHRWAAKIGIPAASIVAGIGGFVVLHRSLPRSEDREVC